MQISASISKVKNSYYLSVDIFLFLSFLLFKVGIKMGPTSKGFGENSIKFMYVDHFEKSGTWYI